MISSAYNEFVIQMHNSPIEVVLSKLMSINLPKSSLKCTSCFFNMSLVEDKKVTDGWCWRCLNRKSSKNRYKVSVKAGSFFECSKLSLVEIFSIVFCWFQEKSISCVVKDFGISKKTVINVYFKIRQIVVNYINREQIRLGGLVIVFQIDESLFSHKVKAHKGRGPQKQIWVFGILDTSKSSNNLYV